MTHSVADKHVIKCLRQTKRYSAKQLLKKFPEKQWTLRGLNHLIRKIDIIGDIHRKSGSGRPRCTRTDDVIDQGEDLALSQEDAPQSHSSQRQVIRQVGISLTSVNRIIKNNLQLKCHIKCRAYELTEANKKLCLDCFRKLLRRYPAATVNFIWFTDESSSPWQHQAMLKMIAFMPLSVFERRTLHPAACYAVGQRSANR